MPDWKLVVVGDRKTPHESYTGLAGVTYLLPGYQENLDSKLSAMIGWNCIQRRNMGFLYAMTNGAELVATVDDDNIPQLGWGDSLLGREVLVNSYQARMPAFDPLWTTKHAYMWHRGFPWQWYRQRAADSVVTRDSFDVQANLWNGAPDIDAICRSLWPSDVRFDHVDPFTATRPMPFKVVFGGATVFQQRNQHDITADFNAEVYGYQNCAKFITDLADNREAWKGLPQQAVESFERYRELVA
jgi:hypothetical protein